MYYKAFIIYMINKCFLCVLKRALLENYYANKYKKFLHNILAMNGELSDSIQQTFLDSIKMSFFYNFKTNNVILDTIISTLIVVVLSKNNSLNKDLQTS
jgi:hypothetical protein